MICAYLHLARVSRRLRLGHPLLEVGRTALGGGDRLVRLGELALGRLELLALPLRELEEPLLLVGRLALRLLGACALGDGSTQLAAETCRLGDGRVTSVDEALPLGGYFLVLRGSALVLRAQRRLAPLELVV